MSSFLGRRLDLSELSFFIVWVIAPWRGLDVDRVQLAISSLNKLTFATPKELIINRGCSVEKVLFFLDFSDV